MYDVIAILVNFNSMHIMNITKKLMQGLDRLSDYVSLKLVLVDNNSIDGSFEEINRYIAENTNIDGAMLRLSKNYGFARAVNIAYRYATKRWKAKYLALLNNDIVIVPKNIVRTLEYLEYSKIAGVQGTIMQMLNPQLIDNAGFLIDQNGLTYPVCRGCTFECAKLYMPSFLSGACSFYRISAVDKIGAPFDDYIDSYYDDKYLGLRLWNLGFCLIHVPLITAYHLGSASYASPKGGILKSPQWFKGIVMADVIPSKLLSKNSLNSAYVEAYYLMAAIMADMVSGLRGYVKSYVQALKVSRKYIRERSYALNIENIVHIKRVCTLRRGTKGIRI